MNQKIKILTFFFILVCSNLFGQMEQYKYKREISGIKDQWHKIVLPKEIFNKVSSNLSDIKIFGITANNDTIEAPYLLREISDIFLSKETSFKIINTSHIQNGHYFTIEIPSKESVNQINLDFKQQNYDWKLKLEGSQNQQEWFAILQDYRILSIKNDLTNFKFSNVSFPDASFRFFRLKIESIEKPELLNATVLQLTTTNGEYYNYSIENIKTTKKNKDKQTEIDISLPSAVPVSFFKLSITDTFDYYRPVTIKYLSDSIKTKLGWSYIYNTLAEGTLNSLRENAFKFNKTFLKKLKIIVHNSDNQPLSITNFEIKGYVNELVTRITEPASYFLTYGNKNATKPQYDLENFSEKIPKTLTSLELGIEETKQTDFFTETEPLFKNKTWLWVVMAIVILLLGWFSLKMIRKG